MNYYMVYIIKRFYELKTFKRYKFMADFIQKYRTWVQERTVIIIMNSVKFYDLKIKYNHIHLNVISCYSNAVRGKLKQP